MTLLFAMFQTIFLILLAPLVAGIIKNTKAKLQNRRGSGIFQVYFDVIKLLRKDSVVSPTVSWLFKIAPYVYLAGAMAAAALVPVVNPYTGFSDLFVLIYLFAVGRFFLALASLDAGSTFGGMGGSREMFISVLVEPALLLALLTVAFRSGSTGLEVMAGTAVDTVLSLPYVFGAIAFVIVMVAETGRIPVDNPDTHLELTMVHEAMVLEYSGRSLALIHLASALKQLVFIILFATMFLPWPFTGAVFTPAYLVGLAAKVLVGAVLLAVIETSTNKMRLFRVPGLLMVSCLLSLLALVA